MAVDVVFPESNEKEFAEMAEKLGYTALCFLYDKDNIIDLGEIKTKLKLFKGALLKNPKLNIKKKGLIFVDNSENIREYFENKGIDVIFNLEGNGKKDFMHQRASGLNHILCNLAIKKNIMVGFSFRKILHAKNKPVLFGRIAQNIRLCRKYKVQTIIASFANSPYEMRSPHDIISFFSCLGMHPKEAKDSLNSILKLV